jgi:type II secretory ATPase GspE/PulE/Tfp pilus assembly ATPase PilB-like protein
MLEVGMVRPEDSKAQEALKFLARQGNFLYRVLLISQSNFEALMRQYRNVKSEMERALEELEQEIQIKSSAARREAAMAQRLVEEAPITRMVAVIIRTAVEGKASDIHVEPMVDRVRVRFRSLGELHASLSLPAKAHQGIIARIKILSNMRIDETRIPQDGRFSTTIDGKQIDFRVATFPTPLGEKVAIRVLDPSMGLKSFEDLGLLGANLAKIKSAAKRPFGLILVTGPTGSGKSTTLYAVLQDINHEGINIVTLEDPVEYFIAGVNHSQIRPEIGYSFASGLRQILRQDPNVIMVGEVRDSETASLVIHAALTGHIVLSTLHTNNALGVIPRLIDMGVDKYLIPATLNLALAQRLVRRLCEHCREKVKPEKAIREIIEQELAAFPTQEKQQLEAFLGKDGKDISTFLPKGCKKCGNTGYTGRIGIFEVFLTNERVTDIILTELTEARLAQEAKEQGMITMRQDGILKVLEGITTIEEVIRVTAE